MNKEQLTEQLAGIEQEIKHRVDIRSRIRQQLADLTCPYIVGDRVINKKGEKAEVTRVNWSSFNIGYKIFIKKIKKDGQLYANESQTWSSDQWSKL